MDCDCGTTIPRGAALAGAAVRWTACAVLAGAFAASGASAATPSHPRPQPENLWRAYPLAPSAPPTPVRSRGNAVHPARAQQRPQTAPAGRGDRSLTTLWIAVSAILVAAVAAACVSLRTRLPRRSYAAGARRSYAALVAPAVSALARAARRGGAPIRPASHLRSGSSRPIPPKRHRVTKEHRNAPRSDVAVLKRKRGRTDAAKISKPLPERPAAEAPRDDVTLLRTKRTQVDRPPAVTPTPPAPVPPRVPRCRIVWWRGYVQSEFHARLAEPEGEGACIATSPPFRWRKAVPPPRDLVAAAAAHARLVAALEAEGWSVAAGGDEWFSLELKHEVREESSEQQRRIQ
jgi:hypothetical protein